MTRKTSEELEEMRRPVVNKVDRLDETTVLVNGHQYELVNDVREAFNEEQLAERYVTLLSRYDYIVGDIGSNQLRLRGFFDDKVNVENELKFQNIEDYLMEYCGFGCPYFILKNTEVNNKARDRWLKERNNLDKKPATKHKNNKKVEHHPKPRKSVNNRKNEVVGTTKHKRQRAFKIREKREVKNDK
ncbi:YutD family protein [Pediococcus argentinicus]|uniref:YutD family protein n=1 Tax=Pediococcus argentinicus TaxID=480391 RepID=UPI00338DA17E